MTEPHPALAPVIQLSYNFLIRKIISWADFWLKYKKYSLFLQTWYYLRIIYVYSKFFADLAMHNAMSRLTGVTAF